MSKITRDRIYVGCLVALPILQFVIFYIGVNFNSIIMAFQKYEVVDSKTGLADYVWGAGLDNFSKIITKLIDGGLLLTCLRNSLMYYFISTIFGVSLSLLFAYYITRGRSGSNVFKTILFLPAIISGVVMIQIFVSFTDTVIPAIYNRITGDKIKGLMSNDETKMAMLIFYNIWAGFGAGILMYSGSMKNVSDSIIEAGRIDGVNFFQELIYIVLPMIYPTIKTFLIAGLCGIFTSDMALFSFKDVNADPYMWTFGYYFIREIRVSSLAGLPELAAFGLILTAVAVPLTLTVRHFLTKFGPSVE